MSRHLSRRRFLAGLGAAGVSLPLLSSFPTGGRAQPVAGPKRLVCVFTHNHMPKDAFLPVGTERDFVLPEILQPLAAFQDRMIVMQGLASTFHDHPGADSVFSEADGDGPSIDQLVAQRLGNVTRLRSLELGAMTFGGSHFFAGPGLKVPPIEHPAAAFQRVFNAATSDPAADALRVRQDTEVLSAVGQRYRALAGRLGGHERRLVEAHLTELADLERRVSDPAMVRACELPPAPDVPAGRDSLSNADYFPDVCRAHMDILAAAFACDVTRVASLMIGVSGFQHLTYSFLGMADNAHDVAHGFRNGDGGDIGVDGWIRTQRWHAEQIAYLVGLLDAIPEGDGTVLDNTVVYWASELGLGGGASQGTHSRRNLPAVLIGSCGGYFDTGRYVDLGTLDGGVGSRPNADLLLTLGHAMGFDDMESFGVDSTGPLDMLRS